MLFSLKTTSRVYMLEKLLNDITPITKQVADSGYFIYSEWMAD